MAKQKLSLGQAIDAVIAVLEPLEEKERETVLTATCAHLGVTSGSVGSKEAQRSHGDGKGSGGIGSPIVDIRTLKTQKQPKSAQQMACLVAYYLQESAPAEDRKQTVTTSDLEKYFKQAGFKLPAKLGQVLIDGKLQGYFDSAGRGEYKLNAVGYNLVAHGMAPGPE